MTGGPQNDSLKGFFKSSRQQAVRMVSISPPMVIHTQHTFDKKMVHPVRSRNPTFPLLWTQPVLLYNWVGEVCAQGRAGNSESFK